MVPCLGDFPNILPRLGRTHQSVAYAAIVCLFLPDSGQMYLSTSQQNAGNPKERRGAESKVKDIDK